MNEHMCVTKGDDQSGATFSDNGLYRYSLWRIWEPARELMNFCMLNPSTADENDNDPTIVRCCHRAKTMGYGGLIVTNIFAYRSTDPKELKKVEDPEGMWNPSRIIEVAQMCDVTICGWGKHGTINGQGDKVLRQLLFWNGQNKIRTLKLNKDGSPAHPLYIGYDVKPIPIDIQPR